MKRTLKSLIIGLALTAVANGNNLTLKQIDTLYHNAVSEQVNDIFGSVAKLQFSYASALKAYRGKLLTGRNPESVATIAALDAEIRNMMAAEGGNLLPLVKGADFKMKTFRDTYERELKVVTDKSDQSVKVLRATLTEQLVALKNRLVKSGDMKTALVVHEKLVKLGVGVVEEATDSSDPLRKKSMVLTKEFGGYASAVSKQKLRLEEGAEYTLTFFAQLGDKVLNEHDCLPRFHREDGEQDFKGGDKNKMRIAQRLSEKRKVSNSHDGWDKVTVKFTHTYNEPVVLGVVFYGSEGIEIALRDFTLTDSEGKNLITKKLNGPAGWQEGEFVSFTK